VTRTFRGLITSIAPTVLRGEWGSRLVAGLGELVDRLSDGMLQAVRSGWVGDDLGPAPDALSPAGNEVSLPRYRIETDDDYLARLETPWDIHPEGGTETLILEELASIGLTASFKYNQDWNWDNRPNYWSRFWVVITAHPWSTWQWGDGHTWGGGQSWGLDAESGYFDSLRAIVRKWKPPHYVCPNIIVVLDPVQWAADVAAMSGNWDQYVNRSRAAAFIDG
jgi:hypothetical protein